MKATAKANANIALVKYWGNRNDSLVLPFNSSISMTCEGLSVSTTVDFSKKYNKDSIIINDKPLENDDKGLIKHIDKIRKLAKINDKVRVVSETNFPVAAGLASSAAGIAALTLAAIKATCLDLSYKEMSILARQGSGSAARSMFEGFVEWKKGKRNDGKDSFSRSIVKKDYWKNFRMVACIVTEDQKKTGSRAGMKNTVATSPFYKNWIETAQKDFITVKKGIIKKDFTSVGKTSELNSLKMHSTMLTTAPPLVYWTPATIELIHKIIEWRQDGLEAYFTMDAGPQVKILCLEKNVNEIKQRLCGCNSVIRTVVCKPGHGAVQDDNHLF